MCVCVYRLRLLKAPHEKIYARATVSSVLSALEVSEEAHNSPRAPDDGSFSVLLENSSDVFFQGESEDSRLPSTLVFIPVLAVIQ